MAERIPALIFYARGVPRLKRALVETACAFFGLAPESVPRPLRNNHYYRYLLGDEYAALSYTYDWLEAFSESPLLDVHACNINNLVEYRAGLRALAHAPLVVVLHSAAGDNLSLLSYAASAFQARRGKLLVFFGNEYRLMPQKIRFAQAVGADYVASQLPLEAARWLYADCASTTVLPAPAALNPRLYRTSTRPRRIDIGFRGDRYEDRLIGDRDRSSLLLFLREEGPRLGLQVDIAFGRMHRSCWAEFLADCRTVPGAEAGTQYLDRDDRTITAVTAFLRRRPDATFDEVFDRFFREHPRPVSGKAISSRHFEPIGTRTTQILLEGAYNGILVAGRDYICLNKDLSNIEDVVYRATDQAYREEIADRALAHVLEEHTYAHRVDSLVKEVMVS